jgi:hypothetical protein
MGEQADWFSNRSGNLLGFVAKGDGAAGWNYAILKRDKDGDFHVCKVMGNFFSLKDARVDLLLWMTGVEKFNGADRGAVHLESPSMPAELLALSGDCQDGHASELCSREARLSE